MSEQHDGEKPAGVRVTITVLQFLVGMVAGVLLTVGSCAGAYTGRYSTPAKQQWWEDHVWTVMPVAAVLGGLAVLGACAMYRRRADRHGAVLSKKLRDRARERAERRKSDFPDDF